MLFCRNCGCLCDPGDIRGGLCDDCREEQERLEDAARRIGSVASGRFYQMKFDLSNGRLYAEQ